MRDFSLVLSSYSNTFTLTLEGVVVFSNVATLKAFDWALLGAELSLTTDEATYLMDEATYLWWK